MAAGGQERPVGLLLGLVGAGKSTLFNKVCDAQREAIISDESCTRQFASKNISYNCKAMTLYDGPGCGSTDDTYAHSVIIRLGLEHEPLNSIFVCVEYNPRIKNNMCGDFIDITKILKEDHLPMVTVVVTKMDTFVPDAKCPNRAAIEQRIREAFTTQEKVTSFVFCDKVISAADLFHAMRNEAVNKPKRQIAYTDTEFLELFELRAWSGRAKRDLATYENKIQKINSDFEEGLTYLINCKDSFARDEFESYLYTIIQQNYAELTEQVYDSFCKKHGGAMVDFDDYTLSIELKKKVVKAHDEFRTGKVIPFLTVKPDDVSDWRNCIRRCQHCHKVWVKVEGCDGTTECGRRPSYQDRGGESFISSPWQWTGGKLRPTPVSKTTSARTASGAAGDFGAGCGKTIVWSMQQVVDFENLKDIFTNSQELANILGALQAVPTFQQTRERKDKALKKTAFVQLDSTGKEIPAV